MCSRWGQPGWLVPGPESPQFSAAGEEGGGPGHPCARQEQALVPRGSPAPMRLQPPREAPAHAAHGRAAPRLAHLESVREERAWSQAGGAGNTRNHPRSGLFLSRPCCAPAPDPSQPPPTLCLLQTIVLHLHKLSGLQRRRCRGSGEVGLSGSMAVRGSRGAAPWEAASGAAGCGERSVRRGERDGNLSLLAAPRREARRRRRARGTGASSRVCAGVAARWGQGPPRHSRPPARPGVAAAVPGLAAGLALPGRAVAAAPSSGAQSAVHCIYLYINKDSSAVVLQ